jgi:catechol 2,3-dioxygenase-like lactoylglutathione lyase family enzyme
LIGAVIFVRDLHTSVRFYSSLLGLAVTDSSTTAAMLADPDGTHLVLRATGAQSSHALGAVGPQYLVWGLASREELERCEHALRDQGAFRERRTDGNLTTVEGHDPDDLVVMLAYSPDAADPKELLARAYAW